MEEDSYVGPNRRVYDNRHGKSQQRCFHCNKLSPQSEMTIHYADGTTSANISVDKKKNWELLEDDSIPLSIHSNQGNFQKAGKGLKGQPNSEHNAKSLDGRQAKKKARQDKARIQKGARGNHQDSFPTKLSTSQKRAMVESSESESEEESEEVSEDGDSIRSISQYKPETSKARILCRQCTCLEWNDIKEKNFREKQRNQNKADALLMY